MLGEYYIKVNDDVYLSSTTILGIIPDSIDDMIAMEDSELSLIHISACGNYIEMDGKVIYENDLSADIDVYKRQASCSAL